MGTHFFDYSATTPIKSEVFDAMIPWLTEKFGNPSSKYSMGYEAKKAVEDSRRIVASMLNVDPSEIFFTSGGSEANTWAIKGVQKNFRCLTGGKLIMSPIEHHSAENAALDTLHEYTKVDIFGRIIPETIKITDETYMIVAMLVNNEVGTIQPIEQISRMCEDHGLYCHVDAVQAFGHIPVDLSASDMRGITTLSVSGHKIGAPKGIGALYIRKDVQKFYRPLICGGQQEQGLRGGTENVASIVGFAKACELAKNDMMDYLKIKNCTYYCWDFLKDNVPNVHMNGLPLIDKNHIANILNVSIEGINGEELVELLNEQGFCVSTGSACNSDSQEPSHVLKAMGLSDELANGSIRISFSKETKLMEVNALCQKIVEDVEMLRE